MQKFKINLSLLSGLLRHIKPQQYAVAWAICVGILAIGYSINFLMPKNVGYLYSADKTCFTNPVLFPKTFLTKQNTGYQLQYSENIKIGNYPIFSSATCLTLQSTEKNQGKMTVYPLGNHVFAQTIKVNLPEAPKLSAIKTDDLPTSTLGEVKLKLETEDKTFTYKIKANKNQVTCENQSDTVVCKLAELKLAQSQKYELEFDRLLNEQIIGTVYKTTIKTVDPIAITEQSIPVNSTVYDDPKLIVVATNKELASFKGVSLVNNSGSTSLKTDVKIVGKQLVINFLEPLPRENTFTLKIDELVSKDQAFLPTIFTTQFTTSGGPKVAFSNISSYGESQYKNFVLNFDSGLLASQNPASFVSIIGPNGPIPTSSSLGDSTITIRSTTGLDRCTNYIIKLSGGLKNTYGIENQNGWSANFRTICQEVFSIGSSVQGRSITAYKFGNGPSKIIFVGATHGDERGSKYLLDSWINELEANFHKIPSSRTIYIVPMINPDGFSSDSRVNANNVDLNRNFPANNWKPDVTMPGGAFVVNGGGISALSEPESSAIASFIIGQKPELVLTYHSKGSMVIANESGNSVGLAQTYGANGGYYATKESALATTFAYDTTGALENWLYDKHSIPTLLIELKTHSQNEFGRNKSAMWAMIQ